MRCPAQRYEIWNTDDLFFHPRVPTRGVQHPQHRYVRLAATDASARLFQGFPCIEATINGKYTSRRSA